MKRNFIFIICCLMISFVYPEKGNCENEDAVSSANTISSMIFENTKISGGLCVHLGCGDGKLTAELGRSKKFLVHGLSTDEKSLTQARKYIHSQNLYGHVSVEQHNKKQLLPYSDNLVNLLVYNSPQDIFKDENTIKEIIRVLAPNGNVFIGSIQDSEKSDFIKKLKEKFGSAAMSDYKIINKAGVWVKITKIRPKGMGDWTHKSYEAHGNTVSKDSEVKPPNGIRWISGAPSWPAAGRQGSSSRGILSSEGLLFQLVANKWFKLRRQKNAPPSYSLIARDSFNGLRLWRRDFSLSTGNMIATGGRVFIATLDKGYKVLALDALSGKDLFTFPVESKIRKMAFESGILVVAADKKIYAVNPENGQKIWDVDVEMPKEMVIGDGQIFFMEKRMQPNKLVKLDLKTGQKKWQSITSWGPWDPKVLKNPVKTNKGTRSPLLMRFYQQGVIIFAHSIYKKKGAYQKNIYAVRAENGKLLWTYKANCMKYRGGYTFFRNGLVWIENFITRGKFNWDGIDPLSGEVKQKLLDHPYLHQKCQRGIATEQFSINSRNITFVDWKTGKGEVFNGVRGGCGIGSIVANGTLYTGLTACGCRSSFIRGITALASNSTKIKPVDNQPVPQLIKGPAFQNFKMKKLQSSQKHNNNNNVWPTYRHDSNRSGSTDNDGPANFEKLWESSICLPWKSAFAEEWTIGPVSSPVIAADKVFVSDVHKHQVVCLDRNTGKEVWRFTAGGRVDSPPTIHGNSCLFGSADGWVYCLEISTGQLIWQLNAAPKNRKIMVHSQLESVWPVSGNIMIKNDKAFFISGRSTHADGGLSLYAIEPATGKIFYQKKLIGNSKRNSPYWGLSDLLVSDENHIYLNTFRYPLQFDPKTGKNKIITYRTKPQPDYLKTNRSGLLNDAWLLYSLANYQNKSTWSYRGITGFMLVYNQDFVCGIKGIGQAKHGYPACPIFGLKLIKNEMGKKKIKEDWMIESKNPTRMSAMVLAGNKLYVSGAVDRLRRLEKGGLLRMISIADGKIMIEKKLKSPPSYDGMAVAYGCLFVSTLDGRVICFGKK